MPRSFPASEQPPMRPGKEGAFHQGVPAGLWGLPVMHQHMLVLRWVLALVSYLFSALGKHETWFLKRRGLCNVFGQFFSFSH